MTAGMWFMLVGGLGGILLAWLALRIGRASSSRKVQRGRTRIQLHAPTATRRRRRRHRRWDY